MKKNRAALSFAAFQVRFLRVLESYYRANAAVANILKDAAAKKLCSELLWHCMSESRTRTQLATVVKDVRKRAKAEVKDAIRGVSALAWVYTQLDAKPHLAEYMSTLKADLLEKQRMLAEAPPSLDRGRGNFDWSIVDYAKEHLGVSNAVLADLLNAAFKACNRDDTISEDGVRHGLKGYRERRFRHQLPVLRRVLSERFPSGDKFTR